MKKGFRWRRLHSGAAAAVMALSLTGGNGAIPSTATALTVEGGGSGSGTSSTGSGWLDEVWPDGNGNTLKSVRSVINAATGPAAALTGQGIGIALIDTGVAPVTGLPAAQLINGPDLSFESQSSQLRYLDTYGHGTHMAGIMIANESATGTVGLSPKAKVTSVKVGTANGAVDVSQMLAAIDWVVANRNQDPSNPIRVLNLSYSSGGLSDSAVDPLQFAVEQAWQAGIVVVVAAGNDGNTTTALTNPAMDPFVIAVGASTTNGTVATTDDDLATYTNLSNRRTLDLLAPGTSLVSLRDEGSNIDEQYPAARVGATLFKGSGTSQAAAVTSATAALLLQQRPNLTPDQVKKLLTNGATPLRTGTAAAKGLRELNLGASLALPTPSTTQPWTKGNGTGSLEATRGNNHLVSDNVTLSGERSIFGPFSSPTWAAQSAQHKTWTGGVWLGYRMAGDTWTGAGGTNGTGQISGYAGKCVDLFGQITTDGTPVQLYDCNNTPAQYWTLSTDGTVRALGKCLDLVNSGTGNGTKTEIWGCDGSASQQWRANSARQLVNVAASRCLDVTDGNNANGTQLEIWDCAGQDNQRWVPPFASRTWAAATWSGAPWTGTGSWSDPNWVDRYWTGHYWSGHYWSGHYWSADDWSTARWA